MGVKLYGGRTFKILTEDGIGMLYKSIGICLWVNVYNKSMGMFYNKCFNCEHGERGTLFRMTARL